MVRRLIVLAASIAAVGALPTQGAWADPSTPRTLTYVLTGCTGPAGTPSTLVGFKQPSEAAALHLTTGAKYVFMRAVDAVTGEVFFTTPGFENNALTLTVCTYTSSVTGDVSIVSGSVTPPK